MSADGDWIASELASARGVHGFLVEHQDRLCAAFGADRITVFELTTTAEGRPVLASIFQRGLEPFTPIQLGLDHRKSIAGYVASRHVAVNISDCYDEAEMARFDPPLVLQKGVDQRTGYRTSQMLAAPILSPVGGNAMGVVEVINRLDGVRFPEECERTLELFCAHLARALRSERTAHRRNPFVPGRSAISGELLDIPALMARAEGAFREHAPADAARAREKLLELYRDVFHHRPRLDPYEVRERPDGPAGAGDVRALEWICRLAECGHVGADRFLDRILGLGDDWAYDNMRAWLRWPNSFDPASIHVKVLANRHQKVARALARQECEAHDRDLTALVDWLDLGGPACSELAHAIRELFPPPATIRRPEFTIVAGYIGMVTRAEKKATDRSIAELYAELALHRLYPTRGNSPSRATRDAALTLLERAVSMGSFIGRSELWRERRAAAPDPAAFMREWMGANPDPASAPRELAVEIGKAVEEGTLGQPPDRAAALRWYMPHLRQSVLKQATLPYEEDAGICSGVATALPAHSALSLQWHERAVALGAETSFLLLLWYRLRTEPATSMDPERMLQQVRDFYASPRIRRLDSTESQLPTVILRKVQVLKDGDQARAQLWAQLHESLRSRVNIDEVEIASG